MSGRGVPIGVAVVGALSSLAGLASLMIGALAVVAADATAEVVLVSVIGMLIGLAFIIFGMGCLKGWGWVWTLGAVMSVVGIVVAAYGWWSDGTAGPSPSAMFNIVAGTVIILYLQSPRVKAWFGKR